MAAPQVTPYSGDVPVRTQDQTTFSNNTADLLTYIPVMVPELNTVSSFCSSKAKESQTSAQAADTAITNLNFKGEWSNLTGALNVPALTFHNSKYWQLLNDVADVTASEPSVSSDWTQSQQSGSRIVATTPTTLILGGKYYIGGSGVVTLPDPSALTDGVSFDITRTPSSEPTITTPLAGGISTRLGAFDDLIMDTSQIELTVKNGVYEV